MVVSLEKLQNDNIYKFLILVNFAGVSGGGFVKKEVVKIPFEKLFNE